MNISRLLAGTALALSIAGGAQATTVNGSLAAAFLGVSGAPPGLIGLGTTFTATITLVSSGVDDFAPIPLGTTFTTHAFTTSVGSSFSFDAPFGDFAGTFHSATLMGDEFHRAVAVLASGTFTPDATFPGGPFDPGAANVTLSLNQTGGAGAAVSGSFTIASAAEPPPVIDVPEPMSMALFGLGLAGLGMTMRRKG